VRSKFAKVITLDPLHEYDGDIFFEFDATVNRIRSCFDDWQGSTFNITCRYHNDDDIESFFKLCCQLPDVLVCVEETEIYLNPRAPNKDFLWMINYGRHRNISLLCIGRRVPELSISLRAQATSIYTFTQTEPRDLQLLEAYGFDQNEVQSLPQYHYKLIGEELAETDNQAQEETLPSHDGEGV
jgi:hypothetical protein